MTDIVERAEKALEGVTPGAWEARRSYRDGEPRSDDTVTIHAVGIPAHHRGYLGIMHGADADFVAAAPELVRELLETLAEARAWASWFTAEWRNYYANERGERDALLWLLAEARWHAEVAR